MENDLIKKDIFDNIEDLDYKLLNFEPAKISHVHIQCLKWRKEMKIIDLSVICWQNLILQIQNSEVNNV
jgi:hypothetical protein